jgi:hypothetical protein
MKEFLLQNWQIVIYALVLLVFTVYLIVKRKWDELRKYALKLILSAEREIKGNKVGQERFDHVLESLYQLLVPPMLQIFITRDKLKKQLQIWFDEVKRLLEYGIE